MTRRRSFFALIALLFLLALWTAACQPQTVEVERTVVVTEQVLVTEQVVVEPTPTPQELVILLPIDFESIDPNTVRSGPGTNMAQQVTEALISRSKEPLLATSWETIEEDTWQFNLREGVEFTNGEPFNAETVKFSIERILREDNENSAQFNLFSGIIDSVEVVDEHTVNIVTQGPFPDLLDLLIEAYMLPPGVADDEDYDSMGVGTGPYMVESWTPGEQMVMVANPDYWGDAPFFDRVIWRPVPEEAVRTTELRAGQADIITQVPIEELGRLDEPGISLVRIPSTQSMRIHLNAGQPPFDDVRVRQAMNYGIDRATIVETLLEGAGRLMNSPSSPGIFGYDPDIPVYPYDPERARDLLQDAGYGGGVDVTIQFTEGRYVRDRAIGEAITAQLADVGIRVNANFSEFSQWLQIFNQEGHGFMVTAQENNVVAMMKPNFYSQNESFKRYNYANEEVDRLIEEAESTLDDDERRAIYQELNQLLHDDAAWVFMWNPEDIYATGNDIVGFEPDGVGFFYLKDLSRR